ncbi:MAG: hypothetical protein KKB21_05190, partial [Nanoarchaeota archaeon]|nr:hypothetical protein [Nanoarchaeota archaeon]
RVQRFYEQGRRGDIEEYVTELEKMLAQESLVNSSPEIKLKWDKELGLTNISIGVHGGFDLVDDGNPQFQEHNLSTGNGGIAAYISTKYISELLKS